MKIFLLSLLFIPFFSSSQIVTLDGTFGANGIVTTPISATSVIHGMAIQSDGKIVAAGTSSDGVTNEFTLVRYNPNGTLDSSFNGNGKVTTAFGSQAEAFCIATQTDGKILAAGYMYNGSTWEFAICRYNTNGSPDSSFGENGKVHTAIGFVDDEINSICVQNDGKIIAAGYSNSALDLNDYFPQVAVVRYNPDGSPDSTFNGTGILTTSFGAFDISHSCMIQPDGKIVIGGTHMNSSRYDFLVVRYNIDGSLDSSFDGDGKAITQLGDYYNVVHSILMQSDGKIVVSGTSAIGFNYSYYDFALARYNSDGSLDNTFNGNGKVITPLGASFDISPSMAEQNDGKIIVAGGISGTIRTHDLAIVRYKCNGSIDSTFNVFGNVITDIDGDDDIYAMKLSGSRIYVGGSDNHFLMVAYQQTFTLPLNLLSFTASLKNKATELQWQATVESTTFFKIERSNDANNFSQIGELPSLINGVEKNYLFTDHQPSPGINYYRLKLTNADGQFSYSPILQVRNDVNAMMKIFPNPSTELIHVGMPCDKNEKIILQITDAGGKTIKTKNIVAKDNIFSESVDLTGLQKGIYFLSVKTNTGIQIQKFIKQ